MLVWNMKLSFGERQPFRIWFDYLKICLNDESLSKKVDRNFYKDWNLTSVKTQKFDTWYKAHENLFTDITTTMKISSGTKSSNSILLEVPLNYSITKVQREVGKVLENKLNKRLSKFTITSNRPLVLPPLDYFLYAWKIKHSNKNYKLEEIWKAVDEHIKKRQYKTKKPEFYKKKSRLRQRQLASGNKAIIISRNINKAQKILENVCKGIFTGNYSDN